MKGYGDAERKHMSRRHCWGQWGEMLCGLALTVDGSGWCGGWRADCWGEISVAQVCRLGGRGGHPQLEHSILRNPHRCPRSSLATRGPTSVGPAGPTPRTRGARCCCSVSAPGCAGMLLASRRPSGPGGSARAHLSLRNWLGVRVGALPWIHLTPDVMQRYRRCWGRAASRFPTLSGERLQGRSQYMFWTLGSHY